MSQGLRALYNQTKILVKITPVSPILIKTGETLDPTKPDMEFVRLKTPFGETVYLPGSSLKGPIRSCAERLLRTLNLDACNVIEEKEEDKGCVKVWEDYVSSRKNNNQFKIPQHLSNFNKVVERYQNSKVEELPQKIPYFGHCYVCRTFGSTHLASRIFFTDAFPWEPESKEKADSVKKIEKYLQTRPGVSIDRRKGSVKAGPFDLEILTGGNFFTAIVVKNYQLWQIGLLFLVLEEINSGFQKIGYGKTRGLGTVKIEPQEIEMEQFGILRDKALEKIKGIGMVEDLRKEYDLIENDELTIEEVKGKSNIFSIKFEIKEDKMAKTIQSFISCKALKSLLKRSKNERKD